MLVEVAGSILRERIAAEVARMALDHMAEIENQAAARCRDRAEIRDAGRPTISDEEVPLILEGRELDELRFPRFLLEV